MRFCAIIFITLAFLLPAQAQNDPLVSSVAPNRGETIESILDRDFRLMMQWFPGEYDNQEQVYFQGRMNVPEAERHRRTHHIFHRATVEGIPGITFYVQQYQNDDPEDIYRQRIYSFEPDYDEYAIKLTIYTPKDPAALKDAHLDESKLAGLTNDDFTLKPGCEVFWKRSAAQFNGYLKENACSYYSERYKKTVYLNETLVLSEDALWINDSAVDKRGRPVFGSAEKGPTKNNKVQKFKCWVSLPKDDGSWSFEPNIIIHDQGGTAWVKTDEEIPKEAGLKIRNVRWPFGYNRDSLVLYAYKRDSDKAVSYNWTEPTSKRVAMNLRWMQASCTLME